MVDFNTKSDLLCTESILDCRLSGSPRSPTVIQCAESIPSEPTIPSQPPIYAIRDKVILSDDRVLQNLLRTEDHYLPSTPNYFRNLQTSISPYMRKVVVEWMLELVQEQQCQPEVFMLAVNYMDRFLALKIVDKSKLQLLGAVCLLLASKFKECCPLPGSRLIMYTDYSITTEELKLYELWVLETLQWELSAVNCLDYLDLLTARLGLDSDMLNSLDIKRRTETMLVLAMTHYDFCYLSPSLMAVSALYLMLNNAKSVACHTIETEAQLQSSNAVKSEVIPHEVELRLRLQTIAHTVSSDIDKCRDLLVQFSPAYLTTYGPDTNQSNVVSTTCEGQRPSPSSSSTSSLVDEGFHSYNSSMQLPSTASIASCNDVSAAPTSSFSSTILAVK